MTQIEEWTPLFPNKGEAPTAPKKTPSALAGAIYGQLAAMKPRAPMAVHFYLGEGLRWIRVGFEGDDPLLPSDAVSIGQAIERCLAVDEPLFFHALRPHDLLFFLEGGDADSMGLPAAYYGMPLDQVRRAWAGGKSVVAGAAKAPAHRTGPVAKTPRTAARKSRAAS